MQKNLPGYAPAWIRTTKVWAERSRREITYALCDDERTLLWFANQRAVEYHPKLTRAGDPDSPISVGRMCPKGSASFQLVTGSHRTKQVLYRRPYGTEWEAIELDKAMDMVAQRVKKSRDENWQEQHEEGHPLRRTLAIAHLGGATLDNEENYLIKKLFTSLGIVQIENQARI